MKEEEDGRTLLSAVQRALPHTGSSSVKVGSNQEQDRSSADESCWVNTDTVRPPENTCGDQKNSSYIH